MLDKEFISVQPGISEKALLLEIEKIADEFQEGVRELNEEKLLWKQQELHAVLSNRLKDVK